MQPELSTLVQSALAWLSSRWDVIFTALFAVGGLLWICARTGSTHVLKARLWQLLLGKPEEPSGFLSKFLADRDALMRFRHLTGIRVATTECAERLVNWTTERRIDLDLVRAAGDHFNVNLPGFNRRPPRPGAIITMAIFASLSVSLALLVTAFGTTTLAGIRVVKTNTWYAVDETGSQRLERLRRTGPLVTAAVCKKDHLTEGAATSVSSYDISVLCELMGSPEGRQAIQSAKREQILATAFIAIILTWWGLMGFLAVRRGGVALRLYRIVHFGYA